MQDYTVPNLTAHRSFDDSVISFLGLEGGEALEIKQQAAHEREETASSIFKNVVSRVKTMMQKDPLINAVSKSEGNIVRMVGYDQLRDSISYLELLYAKGRGSRPTIVNDISVIHDFLLQNQKKFEQGFKEENFNIISFYTTLVGALMHGTHAVILTCVEITKTPNGLHRVDLENNLSEDIILKNIEVAAQSIKSGRADEFMYSSVKNAVASEAVVAIMAFTALIGFFWLIRDVIYYFFAAKNQLANYLETYATFLEMHSATLPTTSGDVPAKQRGIANKMRNIADKFKGKNDALNKRVIKDLKQESNKGLATDGGNFLM